jgi:hypothetical protein
MFILNDLKSYRSISFGSTNHLETLIVIEQHKMNFLVLGTLNFHTNVVLVLGPRSDIWLV